MSDRCPYCSRPLAETITNRIIGYLAEADRPIPSAELRRVLGASETTMYQTTRRLRDRQVIEKSVTAMGNGWVLVDPARHSDGPSASARAEEIARLIMGTLAEQPDLSRAAALAMARASGAEEGEDESIVRAVWGASGR